MGLKRGTRTVSATQTVWLWSLRREAISATRGRMEGGGKGEEEEDIVARVLRIRGVENLAEIVVFVHDLRVTGVIIGLQEG